MPPVAGPHPTAARPGEAGATAGTAATMPASVAQTMSAVVVEIADGLAVAVEGGRFLGIEGLRSATPGARILLSLPTGAPGIGGAVEGLLVGGDLAADAGQALSVRLVAPHRAALSISLQRVADGAVVSALLAAEGGLGQTAAAAGRQVAIQASGDSPLVLVEADVFASDEAGRWLRLETPQGEFLAPSATPGLVPGRRAALLMPAAMSIGPAPDEVAGGGLSIVAAARHAAAEPAVALAALLARSPELSRGVAEAAAQPLRLQRERAGAPLEPAPPGEGQTAAVDWLCLAERLIVEGGPADVLVPRPEAVEPGTNAPTPHRRLIVALDLSRLGEMQIDLSFAAEQIDLTVRSAAPLDPQTTAEVRSAIAAAASVGGGRLRGAVATGLIRLPPLAGRSLPDVVA